MLIQICEHLLTAHKPGIDEQNNANGFRRQLRSLPKHLFDRRAPVLPIIDNETCAHRNVKDTDITLASACTGRRKADVSIHGRCQRREYVLTGVVQYVFRDLWDSRPIQFSLGSKFRLQLLVVE